MQQVMRFISGALSVYMILIFIRVLMTWFQGANYGRAMEILRSVTDPYLYWFRRFPFLRAGSMDFFSPGRADRAGNYPEHYKPPGPDGKYIPGDCSCHYRGLHMGGRRLGSHLFLYPCSDSFYYPPSFAPPWSLPLFRPWTLLSPRSSDISPVSSSGDRT